MSRIDFLAIDSNSAMNFGGIPILPVHQAFKEKRYWRISLHSPPILAALIERLRYDFSECREITLAEAMILVCKLRRIEIRRMRTIDRAVVTEVLVG